MPACGLVGLPNVGKSTLFNALTQAKAEMANYPFCTIDPNTGIVPVVDVRLETLSVMSKSKKIVYAPLEVVDIAGLVKGASRGEGLGNAFLSHIRQTDAIVQVVRCFEDPNVIHVEGKIDPLSDIETIALELALADLQSVQNILQKVSKQARGQKELEAVAKTLQKAEQHLDRGQPLRTLVLTDEEHGHLKPYPFLTTKKILYVANVAESDLPDMENPFVEKVRTYAQAQGSDVVPICAKFEAELVELPPEEQKAFLLNAGLAEPGLHRLARTAFHLLGLITYLTTGEEESRAWTIYNGSTAYIAAGKIHTDIQARFAKAEVIKFEDFVKYRGRVGAREVGRALIVGRDYIVQDGDVMLFL